MMSVGADEKKNGLEKHCEKKTYGDGITFRLS